MINYSNQYIQSILSTLSYAKINQASEDLISQDLNSIVYYSSFLEIAKKSVGDYFEDLTSTLKFFTAHFEILNQEESFNGFSATTYRLKSPIKGSDYEVGEIFVSYRGTENQIADFTTDFLLTFSSESILHETALTQEGNAVQYLDSVLNNPEYSNSKINISGHSLGGYLAARSYYYLDDSDFSRINDVSTFNGAGFSFLTSPFRNVEKAKLYASKVNNIYSFRGLNVTTSNVGEMFNINDILEGKGTVISTFQHLGPRIGTFTENPGGFTGNHSVAMLTKTMGFFSILQNLISDSTVEDGHGNTYIGNDATIYAIDSFLMRAVPENKDFGIAYDALSNHLLKMFNIPNGLVSQFSTPTSQLLSLKDYFYNNPELKIHLLNLNPDDQTSISYNDTNSNRALMYSLLNDLSFTVSVPESYSEGIYKKLNEDGSPYADNIIYNIEYYTPEYIHYKMLYNEVYSKVLEDKILNDLPSNFEYGLTTNFGGLKYAFIDEKNSRGTLDESKIIYVNTDQTGYLNGDVHIIYFKDNNNIPLNINIDKALVFDTPKNDFFIIKSSNNIIHTTFGQDIINIQSGTNNLVRLQDISNSEEQSVYIINHTQLSDAITVKYNSELYNFNDLRISTKLVDSIKSMTLDFGVKNVTLIGPADIILNNETILYSNLKFLVDSFSELFTAQGGHDINFNLNFIDSYIQATYNKFNIYLEDHKQLGVSQEQSDYIISKIEQYETLTGNQFGNFKDYVSNKIVDYNFDLNNVEQNIETIVLQMFDPSTTEPAVLAMVNDRVNAFKQDNYSNLENILAIRDQSGSYDTNVSIDNLYHKKETKNYTLVRDSNGNESYQWDGKYYYNREVDGVQVDSFYDGNIEIGSLINYYSEDLIVESSNKNVSGSDGSDLLISSGDVYGQSNYYGHIGTESLDDVWNRLNGNDVLISNGGNALAYSGNNFIYSAVGKASGGHGDDIVIGYRRVDGNIAYLSGQPDLEDDNSSNMLILKGDGKVNSSNGKNTIISTANSSLAQVNASGNDTYFASAKSNIFFGSAEAYNYFKEYQSSKFYASNFNTISDFMFNRYEPLDSQSTDHSNYFYSQYANYNGNDKNSIYGLGDNIFAVLNYNDFIDITKSTKGGYITGLGGNEIIAGNFAKIYSLGNNDITINGNDNLVQLGENDNFSMDNSSNNIIYSRGYDQNLDIHNDFYEISGDNNTLNFGNSDYTINLFGSNSKVNFLGEGSSSTIFSTETGKTIYNLGLNNSFNISSQNDVEITNGSITNLNLNTKGFVQLSNLEADIATLINDSDNHTSFYTQNNISDLSVVSGLISGYVNGIEKAYLNGDLRLFKLYSIENGSNIQVDGFMEGIGANQSEFYGVSNFVFNQTLRENEISKMSINDSNVINYLSNGNLDLQLINSSINTLLVNGFNNRIFGGEVYNAEFTNANSLSFGSTNNENLFINTDKFKLKSKNSSRISVQYKYGEDYDSRNVISGDSIDEIIIDSNELFKFSVNISNSAKVIFESGHFDAMLTNNTEVIVHLDSIQQESSFKGDNIYVLSNENALLELAFDFSSFTYKKEINGVKFDTIPEQLKIGSKIYTFNELSLIFEKINNSNNYYPSASLTEHGVLYENIDGLDDSNGAFYNESGEVIGNNLDNTLYLTSNKQYIVNAGAGNDYIDFGTKSSDSLTHTVKYRLGDGQDIIKTNGDNVLLNLTDLYSEEITFKSSLQNEITNLEVYFGDNLLVTIEGYSLANVQVQTVNKTYTKDEIENILNTIHGTTENDIITGFIDKNSYIVGGLGNDTINFIGDKVNKFYYSKGDGLDTINSEHNFEVIFDSSIPKNYLSFRKINDNSFELFYNFNYYDKVLIINNADKAKFTFANGTVITGLSIITGASLLWQPDPVGEPYFDENGVYMGTEWRDTFHLKSDQTYHLHGGAKGDTYHISNNMNDNILDYYIGDGLDIINTNESKLKINLKDINLEDIRLEKGDTINTLYVYHNDINILQIKRLDNSDITIETLTGTLYSEDLREFLYSPDIYEGTDGNDVIYSEPGRDNDISGGKGDDLIILGEYELNYHKNIYYELGDGHDTINSGSGFDLKFGNSINPENLIFDFSSQTNQFYIFHLNEKIITINNFMDIDPTIYFEQTGSTQYLYDIFMDSITTHGTNYDDIISASNEMAIILANDGNDKITLSDNILQAQIEAGQGDDTIIIDSNNAFIEMNYNSQDGMDHIILNGQDNSIVINAYDYSKESIYFEYDLNNSNNLNVFYTGEGNSNKILFIENFKNNDVLTNQINFSTSNGTIYSEDIQSFIDLNNEADSSMNSMIEMMAGYNEDDEISTYNNNYSSTNFTDS